MLKLNFLEQNVEIGVEFCSNGRAVFGGKKIQILLQSQKN
jgi:hypothetical protein